MINNDKYEFNLGDYVRIGNLIGRLVCYSRPESQHIDKRWTFGIEIDGFHSPINLDVNEKDIILFFDSIGKYDFYKRQDMDEFMWKQRVLRCADEISKLIEEGKKYR